MSHVWMSHDSHMNESHVWMRHLHVWMHHVTHMNVSCHTYEWVMSRIWISHVSHMNESCHTWEVEDKGCRCVGVPHSQSLVIDVTDDRVRDIWQWLTHVRDIWVMSPWVRQGTFDYKWLHTYAWVLSHVIVSRYTCNCVRAHVWEWVMSHVWKWVMSPWVR